METRANYIIVGLVAILAVLAFAGVIIFAANKAGKKDVKQYKVYFESVSGLSAGNAVQFNGVRVGTVKEITLSEQDQSRVKVVLEIDSKLQMRQGWEATQEIQGITGQSVINISGRSTSGPPLQPKPGEDMPEIPSGKSTIEQLANQAPDLIDAANRFLEDARKMVSDENAKNFSQILESTSRLTASLAKHGEKLEETIENLNHASVALHKLLDDADALVNSDLRGASRAARKSFEQLDSLLGEAGPELKRFSRNGLDEFGRLVTDVRGLVRNLDQLTRKLESNPSSLILGDNVPEYEVR